MQIKVENLCLGYDKNIIARDLNLSVNKGDYICIIGENGTGKSTLVKALLNLQKPISGQVSLDIKRTNVGYLPQQDDIQKDFPAIVNEIVMSGLLNKIKWYMPFYSKTERDLANTALEKVGVADLAKRCYRELSGGQQQRVLLARALVCATDMIILDEPTANLDPDCAKEFYKVLEQINKDGMTIVMVSHDVNTAGKYASHILHLKKDGYFFGTAKEYKR